MTEVIVHGPQGCGKTRNAEVLRKTFGCTFIEDDWHPLRTIYDDTLHLTSHPDVHSTGIPAGVEVYTFEQAMQKFEGAMQEAGASA
jgi:hypothetical protein